MEPHIYTLTEIKDKTDLNKKDKIIKIEPIYGKPEPKLIKFGFNVLIDQFDLATITSNPYYKIGLNFDFDKPYIKEEIDITEIEGEKIEIMVLFKIKKITIQKYSDIDIGENAIIELIWNDLKKILLKKENIAIQLFNIETKISAELIYYLTSFYYESYLYKPIISSILSDSKYLILIDPKDISIPSFPKNNNYLTSLSLIVPENIIVNIQQMNSILIAEKYNKYLEIKDYLDTQIYEGAMYHEFIEKQKQNIKEWIKLFKNFK